MKHNLIEADTMITEDIMSDAELEALANSIPEPSIEVEQNYQKQWNLMLEINKECGVFQDVETESAPEEHKVANDGKYMDNVYGFGTLGHRSDKTSH